MSEDHARDWIVGAGMGVLALLALAIGSVMVERARPANGCHVIGYTASTLYTGTTASGERVIVHAPPTAICKEIPQ